MRLYIRGRQASLASGILILEWITSALFHLQYHDWGETLEQGPNHQLFLGRCSNMAVHCSGCVFTVCVFTAVFVRLYGLNAEHKFRVWVTILGHTSLHFHSISLCLAAQIILLQTAFWMRDNSSFFLKVKIQGWISSAHCSWSSCTSRRSKSHTLYLLWLFANRLCSSTEERDGVSRAHQHVKRNAEKQVAVNRAVFDKVKRVLFYMTTETISRRP